MPLSSTLGFYPRRVVGTDVAEKQALSALIHERASTEVTGGSVHDGEVMQWKHA
jgi:hypothetical protein